MNEEIKKIIDDEIAMLREASGLFQKAEKAPAYEKKMLLEGIDAMSKKMSYLNSLIPSILDKISAAPAPALQKQAPESKKQTANFQQAMQAPTEKLMEELRIGEGQLKKIRKKTFVEEEEKEEFQKVRGYFKLSNRFFLETAKNLVKKGYFSELIMQIKKANLGVLSESYISMLIFSTLLALIIAIPLSIAIGFLIGDMRVIMLMPVIPLLVFMMLYYYPNAEASSISKKIDEELPFAVIHMSSISGAGIEPTQIFKIIGLSKDYPFLRKEIRKVINQINLYGYDLISAITQVSANTSNVHFAELLNGLATTMKSGGSLPEFFQKRAETLMLGYRLEKEKFIKVAETFMDIYISVVIAAPMILMLLLVMLSASGISIGLEPFQMTALIIGGVALVNVIFLTFLQIKQ